MWAVRIPATVAAVGAVLLLALFIRELGGGPLAQGLAAWGYGFGSMPVAFGHTSITAGWDLVAWLAVLLFVTRAVRREEPQWWLAAGVVVGVATWNKLLIPLLVASLVAGSRSLVHGGCHGGTSWGPVVSPSSSPRRS